MNLLNLLNSSRLELQDTEEAIYTNDELIRAAEKSISQMSRLLPKRDILEITLDATMFSETNYTMFNLSVSLALTDYIKIEQVEYPADQTPVSKPTFDVVGDYIIFRQKQTFAVGDTMRVTYLKKWTLPTNAAIADFPEHLDNAVIVGLCGQALMFKAEKYVQDARTQADAITTLLDTLSSVTLTPPELTVPTAPELSEITPPSAYTFVKPTAPTIGAVPSAPDAITLTFTTLDACTAAVDTASTGDMDVAKAHLTNGAAFINAATRGEAVGKTYGDYASIAASIGNLRTNKINGWINRLGLQVNEYQSKINSFQNQVAAYATNLSNLVGKYEQEIAAELAGAAVSDSAVALYKAELDAEVLSLNKYAQEVQAYAAQVSKWNADINAYTAQTQAILSEAQIRDANGKSYLEIAGRYLASGQAKINEFIIGLGYKPEFTTQRAASEQR